jgi:hypothetical protein
MIIRSGQDCHFTGSTSFHNDGRCTVVYVSTSDTPEYHKLHTDILVILCITDTENRYSAEDTSIKISTPT